MTRTLPLLTLLGLASPCATHDSPHAKQPAPSVAEAPAECAHREADQATLKEVYRSEDDSDVLFVRMRDAAIQSKWQRGTSCEGWGTTERYCRDSPVVKGACPEGGPMRDFMYGSAGAVVTIYEPVRPGHWGMDANFGPQQLWMRFGRHARGAALQPELSVGFYYFSVPRSGEIKLYDIDQSDHFAELTASPESFRDAATKKLDELAAQVRTQLASGAAELIVQDGHVPITRPFDAREQAQIVARADRVIASQKALVAEHFRELHALVNALVSPKR